MNLARFSFLISFLLFFVFSDAYSGADDGNCCYSYSGGDITRSLSSCLSSELFVGFADDSGSCSIYSDTQIGCYSGSICTSDNFNGYKLYETSQFQNEFLVNGKDYDFYVDTFCLGTVARVGANSCFNINPDDLDDLTGDGSSGGGDLVTEDPSENDFSEGEQQGGDGFARESCSSFFVGFGNFFMNKNNCESLDFNPSDSFDSSCIYNPTLGGFLSSNVLNPNSFFEDNSCVEKSEINICSDYKTRENCLGNPSFGYLGIEKDELKFGCSWVNSSFDEEIGYCISNVGDNDKNFLKEEYTGRLNLIENPSFNFGTDDWSSNGILTDINSFDRNSNSFYLESGDFLFQEIDNIFTGENYLFSFEILVDDSENLPDLNLLIEELNDLGAVLDSYELGVNVYVDSSAEGVFRKVSRSFDLRNDETSNININLSFSSGSGAYFDLFSLERSLDVSAQNINSFFKPITSIPASASYCSSCYDPYGFSICDEKRSLSMGACSYMVNNESQKYEYSESIGIDFNLENIFVGDGLLSWESQSISNSNLFCEMYLDQNSCLDEENYVNSVYSAYHPLSGDTLCQWNADRGVCFKDSNSDGLFDVRDGVPRLDDNSFLNEDVFVASDFKYLCDSFPPISQIYLTATNSSEGIEFIKDDSDISYGNYFVNVETYDYFPHNGACDGYGVDRRLFLKATANDLISGFYEFTNSMQIELKQLFGEENLLDGANSFKFEVVDQSGNFGYSNSFDLEIDTSAPDISLENLETVSPANGFFVVGGILFNMSNFTFSINDYSGINSCSADFYERNLIALIDGDTFNFNSSEVGSFVLNVSDYLGSIDLVNTDDLALRVACSDIFGQEEVHLYLFRVDLSTNFVLVEPLGISFDYDNISLESYDPSYGAFNVETLDLFAISTDGSLDSSSCKVNGDSISVQNLADDYVYFGNSDFVKNLTGSFTLDTEGLNEIIYDCVDGTGNSFSETHYYIYDTDLPTLVFNLNGSDSYYSQEDDLWYSRDEFNPQIIFEIDGTGSFPESFYNLSSPDLENPQIGVAEFDLINLTGDGFTGIFISSNFGADELLTEGVVSAQDQDLTTLNYQIEFFDAAGNQDFADISYGVDTSEPKFIFSGDIIDARGNLLYTSQKDPLINVSFNTPNYRKFDCTVTANNGIGNFNISRNFVSDFSFSLGDVISIEDLDVDVENSSVYNFDLSCRDIYNVSLISTTSFEFVYDNTAPILDSVNFQSGGKKFYLNSENSPIGVFDDSLNFNFNSTNEVGYTCTYSILDYDSRFYDCNTSEFSVSSSSLSFGAPFSFFGDGSICLKKDSLAPHLSDLRISSQTLNSIFTFESSCTDNVGLASDRVVSDLEIIFSTSYLGEVNFEYLGGQAKAFVSSSLGNLGDVNFRFEDFYGNLIFSAKPSSVIQIGSYYTYEFGSNLIDLENFNEGEHVLYVTVENLGGVSGSLIVDKSAPNAEIGILDSFNNTVYSNSFEVSFIASDDFGTLNEINLFVSENGQRDLIYSSNNGFTGSSLVTDFEIKTYTLEDFEASIIFNGSFDQLYDFELTVTDAGGNIAFANINVTVVDGVGILLEDSTGVLVSENGFSWMTRSNSANLRFSTSRDVEYCEIYLGGFNSNRSISIESKRAFNFDVDSLELGSREIGISCFEADGTNSRYVREVIYFNSLPDYVLLSQNGFYFSGQNYQTRIDIESVGAIRDVSCSYSIGGNSVDLGFDDDFTFTLDDLRDYGFGIVSLTLSCEDSFGVSGPVKTYEFVVEDDLSIGIEDVYLIDTLYLEKFDVVFDSQILVSSDRSYFLEFKTNRDDLICSVQYNANDNLLDRAFGFFKNLFGVGKLDVASQDSPFVLRAGAELSFDSSSEVTISCNGLLGISESFDVVLTQTPQISGATFS